MGFDTRGIRIDDKTKELLEKGICKLMEGKALKIDSGAKARFADMKAGIKGGNGG